MTHNFECLCGAIPARLPLFETDRVNAGDRPVGRLSLRCHRSGLAPFAADAGLAAVSVY